MVGRVITRIPFTLRQLTSRLALLIAALAVGSSNATAQSEPRLTVAAAIETTRAMISANGESVFISPSGRRYALMLIRGEVEANRIEVEILVGDRVDVEHARPQVVARLYTTGLGEFHGFPGEFGSSGLTRPWENVPVWSDEDHLALLWEDSKGVIQVVNVNVETGSVNSLTHHSTHVTAFRFASDGGLIFDARVSLDRSRSEELLFKGFAVTSRDAMSLISGYVDGTGHADSSDVQRFYFAPSQERSFSIPRCRSYSGHSDVAHQKPDLHGIFSPSGQLVVINCRVRNAPDNWLRYTNQYLQSVIQQNSINPYSLTGGLLSRQQVIDLWSVESRPLWDAPATLHPAQQISWSPTEREILIGPTFVPTASASPAGLAGHAIAVVDVDSGAYQEIPVHMSPLALRGLKWLSSDRIEIDLEDGTPMQFQRRNGHWFENPAATPVLALPEEMDHFLDIALRQDLNSPPRIVAVDPITRAEHELLALNPALSRDFALGRVEMFHWLDGDGRAWTGRLYYPANYRPDRRYPLVIQTHGHANAQEYSIYGPGSSHAAIGLGPGWSVYLAQPLASAGIAVLQIGTADDPSADGPRQPGLFRLRRGTEGLQSAVAALEEIGLIDDAKVGIMGHSGTGRLIEFALANSRITYAAAIAGDYADANYLQAALYDWPTESAENNGGIAFEAGLAQWMQNSPALTANRILTPLQLQVTSSSPGYGALLWHWEMFSRLRYLHRPVEYFVVPDIDHGSHLLQNPRQLLVLQNRAFDWWLFWLADREDPAPRKADQYAAWRALRNQRDEALRTR